MSNTALKSSAKPVLHGVNPLANAFAEMENPQSPTGSVPGVNNLDAFSQALRQASGQDGSAQGAGLNNEDLLKNALMAGRNRDASSMARMMGGDQDSYGSPDFLQEQKRRAELEAQAKKVREFNSFKNQEEVFSQTLIADKQKTLAGLEQARREIKLMGKKVIQPFTEIDKALNKEIVNPGVDGAYYKTDQGNMFSTVKQLNKTHESKLWKAAHAAKRAKRGPGVNLAKVKGYEETEQVQGTLHHEVSASQGA